MYLDTVNYCTTAWAKFLSVQLTLAREKIPGRVTDTRDFICKLMKHRFSVDCWIVTADIEDFYPNTKVSDGMRGYWTLVRSRLSDEEIKHVIGLSGGELKLSLIRRHHPDRKGARGAMESYEEPQRATRDC